MRPSFQLCESHVRQVSAGSFEKMHRFLAFDKVKLCRLLLATA
jgi:hypothetical protein